MKLHYIFDYTSGEVLSCSMGIFDNVKLKFNPDDYKDSILHQSIIIRRIYFHHPRIRILAFYREILKTMNYSRYQWTLDFKGQMCWYGIMHWVKIIFRSNHELLSKLLWKTLWKFQKSYEYMWRNVWINVIKKYK